MYDSNQINASEILMAKRDMNPSHIIMVKQASVGAEFAFA